MTVVSANATIDASISAYPSIEIATKLLLSLAIGLLVGFEREWSHKDLGVRTFAITCLFGMLAGLIAPAFLLVALGWVIALIVMANIASLRTQRTVEPRRAELYSSRCRLGFWSAGAIFLRQLPRLS